MQYLAIIQSRLGSTRFPNKVLQTVGGVPMVRRVWLAAKESWADQVVVAWPERYPDLDENDVLTRFKRLAAEFQPKYIIRLTADCPLITTKDINDAIQAFNRLGYPYYNNRKDGHDVQIFIPEYLATNGHKEHVINDAPNLGGTSVNTREDLESVRKLI